MWPSCTRLALLCQRAALHHVPHRHGASRYYDRVAHRHYCAPNSQKQGQQQQQQQQPATAPAARASSTEGAASVSKSNQAANTSTPKPATTSTVQSTVDASASEASGGVTTTGSATTTTGQTATGPGKGEKEGSSSAIPNVPSQSLGLFEEQDARDPNMWKKYAWKYVGAVVLFLGAYQTLHWYVDKVEEENKRRREKNNEQTTGTSPSSSSSSSSSSSPSKEQNADQSQMPFLMAGASPSVVSTAANASSATTPASLIPLQQQQSHDHQGGDTGSSDSDSVDDYWAEMSAHAAQSMPIASSELDELYAYRRELEAQLQTAGAGNSAELKEELEAVNEEIEMFERKKSSTNK